MGFWDFLGNYGQIAGAGAQGAANGRRTEADILADQDRTRIGYDALVQRDNEARAQLELDQKKYGLVAPTARAKSAAFGDALANTQDVNVNRPAGIPGGNVTGGLRPSVLKDNARAAGQELSRQSLASLMSGEDTKFTPMREMPKFTPAPIPQASGWEKFLAGSGQGASLAGGLLGSGGNGSGGDIPIQQFIDWLKNRGTGTPQGYQPGQPVDPNSPGFWDGMVGQDGQPYSGPFNTDPNFDPSYGGGNDPTPAPGPDPNFDPGFGQSTDPTQPPPFNWDGWGYYWF